MGPRLRSTVVGLLVTVVTLLVALSAVEIGVRLVDPLPYSSPAEINHTEHGNLSEYDSLLGWRGVAGGSALFVTKNRKTRIQHNDLGFRDVEHDEGTRKPAIVFLGDSFTWGYEVESDEMFVNLVRARLPDYEIFNLGHRGYGTDQALLTFRQWRYQGPLRWVLLLFTNNDVGDNNDSIRYKKPKPRFELMDDSLVLRGVPVRRTPEWMARPTELRRPGLKARLKRLLLRSHFFHHLHARVWTPWRYPPPPILEVADEERGEDAESVSVDAEAELAVTRELLRVLKADVERRGGTLVVGFVPTPGEVEGYGNAVPYQVRIGGLCEELQIAHFEIAPALKESWFRTYYLLDQGHWTPRGHRIAADVIYRYLRPAQGAG